MTKRTSRLMLVYIALVLALAALGAHNQTLYRQQWRLIDLKQQRQALAADLRAQAATVQGPLAVRHWALSRGMVAVPQGREALEVLPVAPPERPPAKGGLEIRTIWQ